MSRMRRPERCIKPSDRYLDPRNRHRVEMEYLNRAHQQYSHLHYLPERVIRCTRRGYCQIEKRIDPADSLTLPKQSTF